MDENSSGFTYRKDRGILEVVSFQMELLLDTVSGTFKKIKFQNTALFDDTKEPDEHGPKLTLYRAYTDNDIHSQMARKENGWLAMKLENMEEHMRSLQILKESKDGLTVAIHKEYNAANGYRVQDYEIHSFLPDGIWQMSYLVQPDEQIEDLPRIGYAFGLNRNLNRETWYGRGPAENYPDRKTAADFGIWSRSITEGTDYYEKPQACGNREETRWMELTDGNGEKTISILSEQPFSHSFLPYTEEQLAEGTHINLVKRANASILTLDGAHGGLGNASCGQDCMAAYRVSVCQMAGSFLMGRRENLCEAAVCESDAGAFERLWNIPYKTIQKQNDSKEEHFDPSDNQIRKKAGF